MRIRPLYDAEITAVYQNYLTADFPDDERKPLRMIREALARDEYDCLGLFEGDVLRGYAFFVRIVHEQKQYLLLDYFAVLPEYRGLGLGSAFLPMLCAHFPAAECLLIEIEEQAYTLPELRRRSFYLNCGCADTGVCVLVYGVRYRLLEYPKQSVHDADDIRKIYALLYRQVLQKEQFCTKIAFLS